MGRRKRATVALFTFDELSAKAKERALAEYRDEHGDLDYEWWDVTYEDAVTCFGFLGFTIDRKHIHFSVGSGGGDGACFSGTWYATDVKSAKLIEHAPQDKTLHELAARAAGLAVASRILGQDLSAKIQSRGRGEHSRTMELDDDGDDSPELRRVLELARDAADWLFRQLEQEHDYLTDDEYFKDQIHDRALRFTASGKLIEEED